MIKHHSPEFELLSKSQLEDIHGATLEVLRRVGVVFKHLEALKAFDNAGAQVDYKNQRVLIPTYLVEEALRKAPSNFTLYARDPRKSMRFGDGRTYFGTVSTPSFVYDLETGKKRDATLMDAQNIVRLLDYLERIDEGYCAVHPLDVPEKAAHAYVMLTQIMNTDKCIRGRGRGTKIARECLEMMAMVAGGQGELLKKPMLYFGVNPSSPLKWDAPMIEGTMEYIKLRQPVIFSPEISSGATGPVTLAGTMTQHNAEVLSMLTLTQLLNPGTPVMYGTVSAIMDMKTCTMRLGSPELGLMHVGLAQLARLYNLPIRGAAGNSDSKSLDIQAGYETAFNLLLAVLAGVDFVTYAVGAIEFTQSVCYEKILTDHELLGMIKRLTRGINVSDETLAVDVIDEVSSVAGGNFLAHKHTRKHHAEEHFIPRLLDTQTYDSWVKAGSKEIREKARDEVVRILREHQPPPLDKELEKRLKDYVRDIERKET